METLPPALAPLAAYRQFLCYTLIPSQKHPGKMDKVPMSPHTGKVCTAHDPANWTTAEHACAVAKAWNAGAVPPKFGVAFSFQASDPFFFVDIDNAWNGSAWSPVAQRLMSLFPGAAMELSQSGTGVHIFGMGQAPAHGKKNAALGLEFYTELRFCALTGVGAMGNAATDHTAALHAITAEYFPPGAASADGDFALSDAPVPEWRGPTDDDDLIRRALMSKSAASVFGGRASFADLWDANVDVLARAYPDTGGRPYNASDADAALIAHLAFWTGKHGTRIKSLMRRSALVRDKWDRQGDDYLARSISEILARGGDVLQDKLPEPAAVPTATSEAPEQAVVTGQTFLSPADQKGLFAGCVYIQDRHRVLIPGGAMLKPDQFRVAFGGYCFALDNVNERTTRNAWEAFTESQVLRAPRADTICFKPAEPPGALINDAGRVRVNTYWPADVKRITGDVTPFLAHLAKVLPDPRDQTIMLSYMAAIVQYKGVKFPWCPVLQGCEGNGKTFFSACVAMAVGQHFTHWPLADDIASQFNGWIADKIFVALEELQGQDHSADEVVRRLMVLITGSFGVQIQQKGVDQFSMEICANFIATTNHKTAVRKTPDTARRFALFYTAQQCFADLQRDGMTGDYFPQLYAWARAEGFAAITDFLHGYAIPDEFNPAGRCHRAPHTSTTNEAMQESRGGVEQQIAETIAQDTPGFMGGWVSSIMLDRLITDSLKMGSRLSLAKRRDLLQGMGYILHPGLPDGRVNNPVQPDGRKPQLYILANHPARWITGAAEIAKAYTAAQTVKPQ